MSVTVHARLASTEYRRDEASGIDRYDYGEITLPIDAPAVPCLTRAFDEVIPITWNGREYWVRSLEYRADEVD